MTEFPVQEIHYLEDSDDEVFLSRLVLESEKVDVQIIHYTDLQDMVLRMNDDGANSHQLVLVDFNMPGLKGTDAIEELLEKLPQKNLIIGICSGSEDPADKQASYNSGARFFVHKPLNRKCIEQICHLCQELSLVLGKDGKSSIIAKVSTAG